MKETDKEIVAMSEILKKRLPEGIWDSLLLTGGAAAFLYGSDRRFSHDMDFMVPESCVSEIQRGLGLEFKVHGNKPVFHSKKAVLEEGGQSYDLVFESVIEPEGSGISCTFRLTSKIVKKRFSVSLGDLTLHLIPKELLLLTKLLAGRGRQLEKYDFYDAQKIMEKNPDFDIDFFKEMIHDFCQPLKKVQPVLQEHAIKLGNTKILKVVESLEQVL